VSGAGHAGLAASRCLTEQSIDHVILERGEVANSWRRERWDSLRLLTPNWQSRLPGYRYDGPNPDGYMSMSEVIAFISHYQTLINAPVRTRTTVTSVRRIESGYAVGTNNGHYQSRSLILASGACNRPHVPALQAAIPSTVQSFTPFDYRNPSSLAEGGVLVVGASATGVQIADEIHRSGRRGVLSVGRPGRPARLDTGEGG